MPDLLTGLCVLVVSHGNTLRALIKHLDLVGDEASSLLEVPTGRPVAYELDHDMRPPIPGGRHLLLPEPARSGQVPPADAAVRPP